MINFYILTLCCATFLSLLISPRIILFVFLFLFFLNYLFIYLFLAVLGLRFCARAFSSCSEWGLLFTAVHGFLFAVASLVAEYGF